jgi:hypothetical protein
MACVSPMPSSASGVVSTCSEFALRLALTGGGLVSFSSDCTITLSQPIVINQADTIIDANGHVVTISGGNLVTLFDAATNLTLRGLSLVNGLSASGGGALNIHAGVVVIATGCVFAGNSAIATNGLAGTIGTTNSMGIGNSGTPGLPGASAFGGSIYNLGNLELSGCVLSNNTVTAGAGGAGGNGGNGSGTFSIGGKGGDGAAGGIALGGGVYNLGNLTVLNCTFSGNTAIGGNGGAGGTGGTGNNPGAPGNGALGGTGFGGAIYNALNLTLTTSTFLTNSAFGGASTAGGMAGNGIGKDGGKGADAFGGALFNESGAAVTNCTFYTNTVFGGAGGNGGNGGGTFQIAGNGGDGGDGFGGSLHNDNTITIVNCTFSSGGAFGGTNGIAGTGIHDGADGRFGAALGGNLASTGTAITLLGSILTASSSGANAYGSFSDAGFNLSSDFTSSFSSNSLQNTDPKLGPLTFNGGPTWTMALLSGSPAIDKIPRADTPPTDQRGFPRPINGLGDIGAFELGAATNAGFVTLTIAGPINGLVQVTGQGTAGLLYFVQASTDLVNWETVSTNVAPIQFSDATTNASTQFYRVTR